MDNKTPSPLTWKFITRILNDFEEGILILNPEGKLLLMNDAVFHLLNLEKRSIKSVQDLPEKIQSIWEKRHLRSVTRLFLTPYEVDLHFVPGFGDGYAFIFRKPPHLHQELKEKAELMNAEITAVLNSSYDEIFVTDRNGITLRVNERSLNLYGRSKDSLIGKHVKELEKEGVFSPSASLQAIERKENVTVVQTTANNRKLIVQANIIWDNQGEIFRVICTSKDITEISELRKRLNDQQEDPLYAPVLQDLKYHGSFVAISRVMRKMVKFALRVAQTESTVLLSGESGVGKGEVARLIHQNSNRKDKPFIVVNCGAIPENLMESEMFGYEEGAFTGAKKQGKPGFFELADGGILFLDEVAELPPAMQVKLLQVLQDGTFNSVGGTAQKHVNVRVIAATNKNLEALVRKGQFRQDLYYRLHVIPIHIPSLRDRPEDIVPLLIVTLEKLIDKNGCPKQFSADVFSILTKYSWPGNIRELQNVVEWMYVSTEKDIMESDSLPMSIVRSLSLSEENDSAIAVNRIIPLKKAIEILEKELILKAQKITKSTYQIADLLKINQSTVVRKLNKLEMEDDNSMVN
ncbi:sigma-54 interaction domain-containing protein [Ferviditalea candida]|uniref:Sigma 54-interacting transcriptional regulator n=1 Tax=Ferviditalea candida TaxID=3108399 RepID=A0ABU5ZKE8_9BACL|nr:sigma 54-interacting transcriptional regulator [Paenibacillaceae bacterium T2]